MGTGDVPHLKVILSKLRKHQFVLAKELERTKRQLRAEVKARRGHTTPQDVHPRVLSTRSPTSLSVAGYRNEPNPPCSTDGARDKAVSTESGTGKTPHDHQTERGAVESLKRSRSDAGIGPGNPDSTHHGIRTRARKLDPDFQPATTRIDMLPILSLTGEGALEVGLSNVATGETSADKVHMLPVFCLPTVRRAPPGGFLRRIPREETQWEREIRLEEEQELQKMKSVLGVTDRELAVLEEELMRRKLDERVEKCCPSSGPEDRRCEPTRICSVLDEGCPASKGRMGEAMPGHTTRDQAAIDQRSVLLGGRPPNKHLAHEHVAERRKCRDDDRGPNGVLEVEPAVGLYSHQKNVSMQETNAVSLVDRPTPRVLRDSLLSRVRAGPGPCLKQSREALGLIGGTPSAPGDMWHSKTNRWLPGTPANVDEIIASAADAGMLNILELREELERSVVCLGSAVEADVQEVTRMCPVQNPRAVRFLRRCACQRLATLVQEILLSRRAIALERWRRAVAAAVMTDRRASYLRYQGSSRMVFSLMKMYTRRLARAWVRWERFLAGSRAAELQVLEVAAVLVVQTAFRGLLARRRRDELLLAERERSMKFAAMLITRRVRGKIARMRYARLKTDFRKERAVEILNRVGRGMIGRKRVRRIREEAARLKVALSAQRRFRGRKGRELFRDTKMALEQRTAATRIQAIARGARGRERSRRIRRRALEDFYAQRIQRMARPWLARRLVMRLRMEAEASRAIHSAASLVIQRVYRGHRSRILHAARMKIQQSISLKENGAATTIQVLVRGYLSRRRVARMMRKRNEERLEDARLWVETWGEDAQTWFYYNAQTGEATWEPPRAGYTKHDGKLVLTTGQVLEDPLSGLTDEERAEARKQSVCVECEDKRITRKCDQCGDGYCTKCFERTHAHGRRAKHTWKYFGPMECAECEREVWDCRAANVSLRTNLLSRHRGS